MKMANWFTKNRILNPVFILPALILLTVTSIFAQSDLPNPDRGAKVGNAYSISDFETINTINGNLMLNFPIGSLPAGRGDVSGGISLIYSSKLYDTSTARVKDPRYSCFPEEGGEQCRYFNKNSIFLSDHGGWTYNVFNKYKIEIEDRRDQYDRADMPQCVTPHGGPTSSWNEMTYVYRVKMIFPDGSSHEMIPRNYTDVLGDGFFRVNPDGLYESCGYGTTNVSRPVYYSVDGTFLRLETSSTGFVLYFPDGKKVVQSNGNSQRVYDRNGNYIDYSGVISNYNNTGHYAHQVTDQFDRSVTVEYNGIDTDIDAIRVKGFGGADVVWKVKWKTINVSKTYQACDSPCPEEDQRAALTPNLRVLDKIILPDALGGNSYTFSYNAPVSDPEGETYGWGEVSGVTLPTGAQVTYSYSMDGQTGAGSVLQNSDILKNHPVSKNLTYDLQYDGSTASTTETTSYTVYPDQATVISPDGSAVTSYFGVTEPLTAGGPLPWNSGLTYKSVSSNGTMTEKIWDRNFPEVCGNYPCHMGMSANTYVKTEFTSLKDSSGNYTLTAAKNYSYDKNGNVTEVAEYDFMPYSSVPRDANGNPAGLPANASGYLKRINATGYYAETPGAGTLSYDGNIYIHDSSPKLKNTVIWSESRNAASQPVARTEIAYDSTTDTGNPTGTKVWDSAKDVYSNPLTPANSISTAAEYNVVKLPIKTIDARGVETSITYGPITRPGGSTVSDLYPTKVETASNYSTLKRTSTSVYDFHSGLITTATDVDNNVSSVTVYDVLGRPIVVRTAADSPLESLTQTTYDDNARRVIVRSDLDAIGDGKKVGVQFFDQLGRARLTKTLEDAATQSATNETDGVKVQTRYKASGTCTFDSNQTCSFELKSNPYRAATSGAAAGEPTMGWTRSQSLNTGKHSEVETFSGGSLPAPWGSNNSTSGAVKTDLDANRTLVTDQAGKQRLSKANAFGQLTDIWEVTAQDSATSAVTFPGQSFGYGYHSGYSYNTLGNLITVNQGSQTRSFSYSSLSRLLSSTNPESGTTPTDGTTHYVYDASGNLKQKTDPRGVVTDYTFDALNRVTQRSYSNEPSGQNSTPTVTYTYDGVSHAKGKLTRVTTGNVSSPFSVTDYQEFDLFGRVTQSQQSTDGTTYNPMTYAYNLSGALIEETYPSGRKVKNTLDSTGDISQVQSRKDSGSGYWTYANSFTHNAAGAVTSMQLGNGHWGSTVFNNRLQPTQIALGTTPGATDLLKLNYDYGSAANNGNIQSQTITVPTAGSNAGFIATQVYNYDALNRLKDATETVSNVPTWKQTFTYDRYGNRRFDTSNNNTTTLEANCATAVCNPEVDPQSNRLTGYTFDNSGNTKIDAEGRTFLYDGENKQIEVRENNVLKGKYYYDGDGKRVKKEVPGGETTIFVYDAAGKLVAEYSTQLSPEPQVAYLTEDNLGTPRINTGAGGSVIARHDYHPFGEEISTPERTQAGYDSDDVRKKFTGYEKDTETDLNFAQNRYQSTSLGRFLTPDPILSSGQLGNPATWNRYSYVLNNPLIMVDPLGLWAIMYRTVEWQDSKDGKVKVKKMEIYFIKTDEDDDADSLLEGLGISKDGKGENNPDYAKMKAAIESSLKDGEGSEVLSSEIGNKTLSKMYDKMSDLLRDQENFMVDHPKSDPQIDGPPDGAYDDCSMTTFRFFNPSSIRTPSGRDTGFDVESADEAIKDTGASSVDPGKARAGDFVRMADGKNNPQHFMTLAFTNETKGVKTQMFFSRTGANGPFQLTTVNAMPAKYGAIRGVSDKHTGYYGRR